MTKFLTCIALLGLLSSCLVKPIAGNFDLDPKSKKKTLSNNAKKVLDETFKGINAKCIKDYHVHAVGVGAGKTGAWVNPHMTSLTSGYPFLQFKVYLSASGITDYSKADQQYVERLINLSKVDERLGSFVLLAFDFHHDESGKKIEKRSSFHIPNEYVYSLQEKYPSIIDAGVSIHPDKVTAVDEVESWGKKGVRFIKWLPNSMRIDPSNPKYIPYYKMMKKYNMTLLTHTGHEKAVEGEEFQELANPLRLRLPLSEGVRVAALHLASLGDCKDLDNKNKMTNCFDLFWRMFTNKKWEKNLLGEISAVTIHTRVGKPLNYALDNPQLHKRLINGSDYPLPAINILYRTGQFQDLGYINEEEREALNEIYEYNPLLFDLALKRTIKHPKTGKKFSPVVFESLECRK